MEAPEVVNLEVEVLRKYDWALLCRIGEKRITIPFLVIHAPSPLPLPGDRVTLVVSKEFAVGEGLV